MNGLQRLMETRPPKLDDSDGKWIEHLFKVLFYVALIAGGTWFLFTWSAKSVKVQEDVTWIKRAAVTRREWQLYVDAENRERRRLWEAIHKPGAARDIDTKAIRRLLDEEDP